MGLIVLDTGVVIAVLDSSDPFHGAARRRLSASRGAGDEFLMPVVAYAEALVGAISGGRAAETILESFLDELPARIVAIDREVARVAASLRATAVSRRSGRNMRLPDAMIVATAIVQRADSVVTTDAAWPRMSRRRPSIEVLLPR